MTVPADDLATEKSEPLWAGEARPVLAAYSLARAGSKFSFPGAVPIFSARAALDLW